MRSKKFLGVLAAMASICLVPVSARATTVDFTYTGVDSGADVASSATGYGSFTVVGNDDLTAFNLTIDQTCTVDFCGIAGDTDVFNYGLSDLESLNATFSGDTLTALSFMTDVQPSLYDFYTAFEVDGLGANQASTLNLDVGQFTVGTLAIESNPVATPEPSSFVLLALGLSAALFVRQRNLAR